MATVERNLSKNTQFGIAKLVEEYCLSIFEASALRLARIKTGPNLYLFGQACDNWLGVDFL